MADLKSMIDYYGKINGEYNTLKKDVEEKKAEIKTVMLGKTETADGDDYSVTCKVIEKEFFNDIKLVHKLKKLWKEDAENPYIKTIEVPHMEEIEKAIYSGEIDPKELADCKDKKEEVRLTVKKKKK